MKKKNHRRSCAISGVREHPCAADQSVLGERKSEGGEIAENFYWPLVEPKEAPLGTTGEVNKIIQEKE